MQSVLILGAGLLQRPSILAAKRLGYKAVVVDANCAAVCVPDADEFHLIDLKDKEGILRLGKELMARGGSLSGVFTAGTDFSTSVSYVAQKLSLPGHSYQAALNASDKGRMRECFARCSVPSPAFFVVSKSETEGMTDEVFLKNVKERLSLNRYETNCEGSLLSGAGVGCFPFVIKPVDNMGARGCRMVRNEEEARMALDDAFASSRTRRAIVEEYMAGEEYSIDALVFDGEVTITGFADRHIYYPPYFIEMGHTMPACIDEEKRTALIEAFAQGIAALGLTHGAAKADIKWTSKGPMIGEIAARLSGGYMSGWTYPYASGLDLTEAALLLSCGRKPEALLKGRIAIKTHKCGKESTLHNGSALDALHSGNGVLTLFDYPCNAVCAERAWVSIPGTVSKVVGLDEAANAEGVKDVFPRAKAGDEADFPRNNVQKCGNVIAVSRTREAAIATAEAAAAKAVLILEAHNKRTDDFLFGCKEAKGEEGFPPMAYDVGESVIKQVKKLYGVLGAKQRAVDCIPECLMPLAASDKRDFNCRKFMETLVLFDKLCAKRNSDVERSAFWMAVLRGGVQGALYAANIE